METKEKDRKEKCTQHERRLPLGRKDWWKTIAYARFLRSSKRAPGADDSKTKSFSCVVQSQLGMEIELSLSASKAADFRLYECKTLWPGSHCRTKKLQVPRQRRCIEEKLGPLPPTCAASAAFYWSSAAPCRAASLRSP